MVTFDVSGLDLTVDNIGTFNAGPKAYVLFFETGSDGSYNDLVVLVQGPAPVVPAPAAAGLAFVGLAIVGWVKRRLA